MERKEVRLVITPCYALGKMTEDFTYNMHVFMRVGYAFGHSGGLD